MLTSVCIVPKKTKPLTQERMDARFLLRCVSEKARSSAYISTGRFVMSIVLSGSRHDSAQAQALTFFAMIPPNSLQRKTIGFGS